MAALVSSLTILDDEPLPEGLGARVTNGMILEAAHAMQELEEEREDELRLEQAMFEDYADESASSPHSPLTPKVAVEPLVVDFSAESELTHGSDVVLAGGVAAAIRKRRGGVGRSISSSQGSLHGSTLDSAEFLREGDVTPVGMQDMHVRTLRDPHEQTLSSGRQSEESQTPRDAVVSPRQHNSSRPPSAAQSGLSGLQASMFTELPTNANALANASFKACISLYFSFLSFSTTYNC